MANKTRTVSYEVELGIKNALDVLARLKNILTQSVKPDSTNFKVISRLITNVTTEAERLKASMGTAFKTSDSTKRFSTSLEKLGANLTNIEDKMRQVSTQDLLFSREDTQLLEQEYNELKKIG